MTAPATQTHEDDILGKAYDSKLMRRLLVYTRPYRALMYGAFALLCVEGGVQVVGPLLTRRVIDVAVPAHDMHIVAVSTSFLLLALVADFITSYGQTWLTSLLGQRVMRDLRMEIFEHLQRLSVSFFDRNPAGRLITRVTSDVETLNELFTSGVVSGLGDLFTLIAISVAMLTMDWRLALASFAVIPFVVMVSGLFRKGVRNTYRDIQGTAGPNQLLSAGTADRDANRPAVRSGEARSPPLRRAEQSAPRRQPQVYHGSMRSIFRRSSC